VMRALNGSADGLTVADSPIHGRGLWSMRTRRAGETLFVVHGRPVNLPFDYDYARGPNWIGTGWESWIAPERGNPIRFTNHSCDPNVIVSEGLAVIAIEDIPSGGEILLDYATTEVDPSWRFRCRCGSPHCRKQVRSYSFLPKALHARYAAHLPDAFLEAARRVASTAEVLDKLRIEFYSEPSQATFKALAE
jgi:uncharacterized protein